MHFRRRRNCVFCQGGVPHNACRPRAPFGRPLFRRNPVPQKGSSYTSPWGFRGLTGHLARALLGEPNLVLV